MIHHYALNLPKREEIYIEVAEAEKVAEKYVLNK